MFYSSVLESVLSFCLSCWGGNCSGIDKNKLKTIVKKCNKITKNNFLQINELFEKISLRKINYILKDLSHPFQIQSKESISIKLGPTLIYLELMRAPATVCPTAIQDNLK